MESVDAQIPLTSVEKTTLVPKWSEIVPTLGVRTNRLIESNPNLGRLEPVRILESIKENSETGILLFPGGIDRSTEDEALKWGQENEASVFHIKYPTDSSFSIDREVSQVIDHTTEKGIKNFKIMSGSWGGIPAFKSMYNLLKEENVKVDCFIAVAAALQPADFTPMVKNAGKLSTSVLTVTKGFTVPGRQIMARISNGIPDSDYSDPIILDKIEQIPTLLLVPPGGQDWWINAEESYKKYFPNARKIEYPAYKNFVEKVSTIGGHDSKNAFEGIRQIEKDFLKNPNSISANLPEGFKLIH